MNERIRFAAAVTAAGVVVAFVAVTVSTWPHANWVQDDVRGLADHAHPGDIAGEWTHSTYEAAGGPRGWVWMPLATSAQQVWGGWFGRSVVAFRALSLLLHLAAAMLVAVVARALGAGARPAWLAAAFVAAHPIAPDSACWPSDASDVLGACALLLGFRAALAPARATAGLGAFVALSAGLFCKPTMVAGLPFLVLVALWAGDRRRAGSVALAGLGAMGAWWPLYSAVTTQGSREGAALGAFAGIAERGAAWLHLCSWLLWLPHTAEQGAVFDPAGVAGCVIGAGVLILGAALFIAGQRAFAAAIGTFALLVGPAGLLVVPATGILAFRYAYVPLALAAPLLALGLHRLQRAWTGEVVLAMFLLASAPRTLLRAHAWVDEPTLWQAEHDVAPADPYVTTLWAVSRGSSVDQQARMAWAGALDGMPPSVRIVDVDASRLELAKADFRAGDWPAALAEADALHGDRKHAAAAACIAADALDRLRRHDEANTRATDCR